ncbi:YncE family protein [Pseudomonas cedrina subsp. fulgida]|nr:YncE family protein [Pseudomonas cedrina subsp. fulgida]
MSRLLLESHGSEGLICVMRAYAGQREGDFIELFCGNLQIPVDVRTVTEQEALEAKPVALHISMARLPEGAAGPIFLRVTHLDQRVEETQRLTLKVDTVSPTGSNAVSEPPWENERLPRPQPTLTLVDSAAAGRGVGVSIAFYPVDASLPANTHRTVRDRIRLYIGGQVIEHRVTENEASGRNPITLMIYYGTWLLIGSGYHACTYAVIDEVGNYAPGHSPMQLIEVRLDPNERLLDPAQIVEAPSGTLNADRLAGSDATLRVAIANKGWVSGDGIRLTIRGRMQGGIDVEQVYNASIASTTVPFADFPWPNADLRLLIGALIQLSYERVRPGQVDLPSENIFVQVSGTPTDTGLAAPQVCSASGGVLHPLTDPVTVRVISYTGQKPSDQVTLVLEGIYANGHRFYQEHALDAGLGDVVFDMPNGVDGDIRQLDGGRLMLYYFINLTGQRPPSAILTLDIGEPQDALPAPQIQQAPPPDLTFDPEVSKGNANVTVQGHASFTEGATVTLYVEGSALGGSAPPAALPITAPWVGRDLSFVVARVFIVANLNGSARIYYRVNSPNQRTRYSQALVMKVGSGLQLPVPRILESTFTGPATAILNPIHLLPPAPPICTFRVSYSPMPASDDIQPRFNGASGPGTPALKPLPGNPALGYVDFAISNLVIAANLGKTAALSYTVTRAGATTPSQVSTLAVTPLPAQLLDLVSVPQAAGGIIHVNSAYTVLVREWPFMRAGQAVWIDINGPGPAGLMLRGGTPLSPQEYAARRIELPLPNDYLRTLPTLSNLSVEVRVSLNGNVGKYFATDLRTVNYRINNSVGIFERIPVGTGPNTLALSPDGSRLYVGCLFGKPSIWVIDTLRNRVLDSFEVPGSPIGMAIHPTAARLYVTDNSVASNTPIRVYSTQDHTLVDTLTGFDTVSGIAFNTTGSRLYVADNRAGMLIILNATNHQRLASVPVSNPIGITLSPDNSRAHIATLSGWAIVNLTNNSLINHVAAANPTSIVHNPRASQVYITRRDTGVAIGNTQSQRIEQTLTGLRSPYDVAFQREQDIAYVTQTDGDRLGIIDTRLRREIGAYTGFNKPRGVVVASDGSHGYVANMGDDTVAFVVL